MSGPVFVGSSFAAGGNVARTPAAGNDLILLLQTFGSSAVLNGLNDSVTGAVAADFPFAVIGSSGGSGLGVYRVHNASGVSHVLSPNWGTAPGSYFMTLVEASNVGALDTAAGTLTAAVGTSSTVTTNSLAPSTAGDLMLVSTLANHFVSGLTWNGGYTSIHSFTGGPFYASAYLNNAPSGSQSASNLLGGTVVTWTSLLVAYSGALINSGVTPPAGSESVSSSPSIVTPAQNTIVTPLVARKGGLLVPRRRTIILPTRRAA